MGKRQELIVVNQLQNVACFISLQYFLICLISTFSFCLFLFWFRWGVFLFCFVFSVCLFPSHLTDICFYFTDCLELRPVFTESGPAWFTVKKKNIQQLLLINEKGFGSNKSSRALWKTVQIHKWNTMGSS